jgi:hypothetical protein
MTRARTLSTRGPSLPVAPPSGSSLGVLSIHLGGTRCRVGCEFCYLGQRAGDPGGAPDAGALAEALARLDYQEVAVALSEPIDAAREPIARIAAAAQARGKPLTITTTAQIVAAAPELLERAQRVNLSIDPRKGPVAPARVELAARAAKGAAGREVVLIVSLTTPEFAESLLAGGLQRLLAIRAVDKVALNALKPPPEWCGRAFWLAACARLAPLLAVHLDRRLFLDCWVAARILGLGGCPARPDLSPGGQFRACVYQPAPDFVYASAAELEARLDGFEPPAACPFPIP